MFSRLSVHCPICKSEFDGMRPYGRDWKCCCKKCHDELEWRRTLAIVGKEYYPQPEQEKGTP